MIGGGASEPEEGMKKLGFQMAFDEVAFPEGLDSLLEGTASFWGFAVLLQARLLSAVYGYMTKMSSFFSGECGSWGESFFVQASVWQALTRDNIFITSFRSM